MQHEKEYLTTAHSNDVLWKNELAFYKDEIKLMRKRLGEVSAKNSIKEVKMLVSHFENQFIINDELIDELTHDINQRESQMANELKENSAAYEHRLNLGYAELKGKVSVFKKLFTELRQSFNAFTSVNM